MVKQNLISFSLYNKATLQYHNCCVAASLTSKDQTGTTNSIIREARGGATEHSITCLLRFLLCKISCVLLERPTYQIKFLDAFHNTKSIKRQQNLTKCKEPFFV